MLAEASITAEVAPKSFLYCSSAVRYVTVNTQSEVISEMGSTTVEKRTHNARNLYFIKCFSAEESIKRALPTRPQARPQTVKNPSSWSLSRSSLRQVSAKSVKGDVTCQGAGKSHQGVVPIFVWLFPSSCSSHLCRPPIHRRGLTFLPCS